jgi:deoxyribodipyrimidine photo-lyase
VPLEVRLNSHVPSSRVRAVNDRDIDPDGRWVVYWMTAARRTMANFGLERAADWARHLGRPLLVLEALRCDYRWASDRLHRFIIDGMIDNQRRLADSGVTYYPYVEPSKGDGRGLLAAIAELAAVVVTDDFPTFFLPRMVASAGQRITVRLEAVDSNGLLPMAAADREHATAFSFRRFLQSDLLAHLEPFPLEDPCQDLPVPVDVPSDIADRWRPARLQELAKGPEGLSSLPIDHSVGFTGVAGGSGPALARLRDFIDSRLDGYAETRNRPDDGGGSGLSPYLHFGHVSAQQVFREVMLREGWSPEHVIPPANGRRAGWWGASPDAEAFLDQVVTWRELGFNVCHRNPSHDRWESLPAWAQQTLLEHVDDARPHTYTLADLADANTHDPLWNAAQNELVRDGVIHNYLRMLWGKKILEWTEHPRQALDFMIELNNRYALDGRDPNSYTGIFWVLGRHDRAWGPERPIFGKVRYMTSENTARKLPVRKYMERYT